MIMFDVSAYCISLYLEMQSKNKMNPPYEVPKGSSSDFFASSICQTHTHTSRHSLQNI